MILGPVLDKGVGKNVQIDGKFEHKELESCLGESWFAARDDKAFSYEYT